MVFLFVLLIEFWRNVHLKAIVSTHFLHFTPFHFYSFSTLFERITRQLKDEKYLPPSKFLHVCYWAPFWGIIFMTMNFSLSSVTNCYCIEKKDWSKTICRSCIDYKCNYPKNSRIIDKWKRKFAPHLFQNRTPMKVLKRQINTNYINKRNGSLCGFMWKSAYLTHR